MTFLPIHVRSEDFHHSEWLKNKHTNKKPHTHTQKPTGQLKSEHSSQKTTSFLPIQSVTRKWTLLKSTSYNSSLQIKTVDSYLLTWHYYTTTSTYHRITQRSNITVTVTQKSNLPNDKETTDTVFSNHIKLL